MRQKCSLLFSLLVLSVPLYGVQGCSSQPDDDDDASSGTSTPTATPTDSHREHEPNNSSGQAESITPDMAIEGQMGPGDLDYYLLKVPKEFSAYKLTITVEDPAGKCFSGVDPNLRVDDASTHSMLYWMEDSVEDYCPIVEFVPLPGASYYLVVGTDWSTTGDYTLTVLSGGHGTVSGKVNEASHAEKRAAPAAPSRLLETPQLPHMPGELLIKPARGVSRQVVLQQVSRVLDADVRLIRPMRGGEWLLLRWAGRPGASVEETSSLNALGRVRGLQEVSSAELNRILQPSAMVDDPYYVSNQWDLRTYPGMNLEPAWESGIRGTGSIVAVLDTGHDPDHEDLMPVATDGYDFITYLSSAGDGDGPDDDPDDAVADGHGSHVAGTAAAATNNGKGVAGVGWGASYMPLRVCGSYGCTEADIIEAVDYASGLATVGGPGQSVARADVINLSLGGHDYCSQAMQDAVTAATNRGVVVVAAAGNEGDDAARYTPGNCLDVVTVGASNAKGECSGYSNRGPTVDIAAPGDSITSSVYSSGSSSYYGSLSGTSMATPHIAGLVALIKAENPTLQTPAVLELLQGNAHAADESFSCGVGVADASQTLAAVAEVPDGSTRPVLVVQGVRADGLVVSTVSRDGVFYLEGLSAGNWTVQAGTDLDGDGVLQEMGETYGVLGSPLTVTSRGEDVSGAQITVK